MGDERQRCHRGGGGGPGARHDDRGFRPRLSTPSPRSRSRCSRAIDGRTRTFLDWPFFEPSAIRAWRDRVSRLRRARRACGLVDHRRRRRLLPAAGRRAWRCRAACSRRWSIAGGPLRRAHALPRPRDARLCTTASPISPSPCRASAVGPGLALRQRGAEQALAAGRGGGKGDRRLRADGARGRAPTSPRSPSTATPDGADHVRLNGEKTYISNGGIADRYVVFARTGEAPGARGLSAFMVEADARGPRRRRADRDDRAASARPPPLRRLPGAGGTTGSAVPATGFKVAMATLDVFRVDRRRGGARLRPPRLRRGARPRPRRGRCSPARSPTCS